MMDPNGAWASAWRWVNDNPSTLIALGALLVSVTVAWFTIQQMYVTRRHNRLSVRPLLDLYIESNFQEGPLVTTSAAGVGHVTYALRNTGVGPAIIKSYRLLMDGNVLPTDSAAPQEQKLRELLSDGPMVCKVFTLTGPYAVRPSGEVTLLDLIVPCGSTLEWNGLLAILDRCDLDVCYESLYNEKFMFKRSPTPRMATNFS